MPLSGKIRICQSRIKQSIKIDSNNTTIFRKKDYCDFNGRYLFKYINHDSLKYINEGKFQLGSILYYREMENLKARDELEGINYFSIRLVDREFGSLLTGGLNYYVFCATNQNDGFVSDYHTDCFGKILLKIDAIPFVNKISEIIGSNSYKIHNVNYSDAKIYKASYPIATSPEEMSNLTGRYATKLFDYLKDEIILPCLFTKSFWFKPENEIRVAFEIPYNASSIPFRFECKDLLNYIEIIHL